MVERPQAGQQPRHHRLAGEGRRGADALHRPVAAGRPLDHVDDRHPEPLRILARRARQRPTRPTGRCLAAMFAAASSSRFRRGADERDTAGRRGREPVGQPRARDQGALGGRRSRHRE